jgi:hypothetical protein
VKFLRVPQTRIIAGVLSQLLTGSRQWPKAKDANVATQPY